MPGAPGEYWDLLDRNTAPPVRRRVAHVKTRTGCLTCKRRKVKCDEVRPNCERCAKSGFQCAGYAERSTVRSTRASSSKLADAAAASSSTSTSTSTPSAAPHHQPLLRPKPPHADGSLAGSRVVDRRWGGPQNLVRTSLTPTYLGAGDAIYFERFKYQMIADLGVWCGAEFWRHTILREVLLDKTVQHASLAAAALLMDIDQQRREKQLQQQHQQHEPVPVPVVRWKQIPDKPYTNSYPYPYPSYPSSTVTATGEGGDDAAATVTGEEEAPPLQPQPSGTRLSNTSAYGRTALRHYTTAVWLCRQGLQTTPDGGVLTAATARSSMTAAFFFAIFELCQGNLGEADRLLAGGAALLDHALAPARRGDNSNGGPPALVLDSTLRQIRLAFDRMRVAWDVCPSFAGTNVAKHTPRTGTGTKTSTTGATTHSPPPPPPRFEVPSMDTSVRTKQMFWNEFSSDFARFMAHVLKNGGGGDFDGDGDSGGNDLAFLEARRASYLDQLGHWLPVLEDLCAREPGSAVLATIKAHAQYAVVWLNCLLDPSELAYDSYLHTFRDVIATYQRLCDQHYSYSSSPSTFTLPSSTSTPSLSSSSSPAESQGHSNSSGGGDGVNNTGNGASYLRLTLDVDLFHVVTFTVSKCRDRSTRAQALRVFADLTRPQAMWANLPLLPALRALVRLEDRGRLPDGSLPPDAPRYHYVRSEWDWDPPHQQQQQQQPQHHYQHLHHHRRRMIAVFLPTWAAAATATPPPNDSPLLVREPIEF